MLPLPKRKLKSNPLLNAIVSKHGIKSQFLLLKSFLLVDVISFSQTSIISIGNKTISRN